VKYLFSAAFLFFVLSAQAFDWQVQRYEGRDYVPVTSVAEYYGLKESASPPAGTLLYENGPKTLQFTRESREAVIDGVNQWFAFPVIEENGRWFVSRMDVSKTIDPALVPQNIKGLHPVTTVVLDAGHGGQDRGAYGSVASEKDFTLDVARRLRNRLQHAGLRVIMTRNQDVLIPLEQRARIANAQINAIFVSIHFNSAPNQEAKGFEIYCVTPRGSPSTEYEQLTVRDMVAENGNQSEVQSFALANAVYHSMEGTMAMTDRGVKRARFAVLRLSDIPSVLVEGGFLSNPEDVRNVATKAWRDKYADALAAGIIAYKNLCEHGIPPKTLTQYRQAPIPTEMAAGAHTSAPKSN